MSDITAGLDEVTLINVSTVEPQNQQQLVDLLQQATVGVMSKQTGYLSARIHRSLDGGRVAVYAPWRSREDFEALAINPDATAHMRRARALASFEPVLYKTVFAHQTITQPGAQERVSTASPGRD
jgi:heme-degrading monooxygenase HmoA